MMPSIAELNRLSREASKVPVALPAFAGELIGKGGNRAVYAHRDDPTLVVKVAHNSLFVGVNIEEFTNFLFLQQWHLDQYIAPCISCDPNGEWLIMRRTTPALLPATVSIPLCLRWDMKAENWGMLDGRLVCHDYQCIHDAEAIKRLYKQTFTMELPRSGLALFKGRDNG